MKMELNNNQLKKTYIEQLIRHYELYQKEGIHHINNILASLNNIDLKFADTWADIIQYWDYINNEIEAIVKELKQYPLKDKYLKVINDLTKSLTKKDSDRFLNIDTFRLFYHLFKNTFYEDINDEEIYY